MLEGDVDIMADEDTVLMIGIKGEVYPLERAKFDKLYTLTDERFSPPLSYPPMILNPDAGDRISLLEHARVCVGGGDHVLAARLRCGVRIFTRWDSENYFLGNINDWIIRRSANDLYVVTADVFDELYIRDFTGEDITDDARSMQAVKKDIPVPVIFASEDGALETREGVIAYRKGDALLTGCENESWPVEFEHFNKIYAPIDDTLPGMSGHYSKKAFPISVLQVGEPFMVSLPGNKGTLRGKAHDWLLQYSPDNYGIVDREIFEATYEIVQNLILY
jgi:hypothetical protein